MSDSVDQTVRAKWETLLQKPEHSALENMGRTILRPSSFETFERQQNLGTLPRILSDSSASEFQVTRTLGQGGMGLVRLARQTSLGRDVAIKTLLPDRADEDGAQDLLRESWITGLLEHPNIVPVHALGLDEAGGPMLVMKRVEGVSWQEALNEPEALPATFRAGREDLETHIHVLIQVCNALEFAHSKDIIHCDLKPENVMLGEFGEVYLLDWGVAVSLVDDGSGRLPLAKNVDDVCGTPGFIAPELAAGEGPRIGPWTDVYLLGATLHTLLTGETRHQGASVLAVLLKAYQSEPVDYGPHIPRELAQIANRATASAPKARFQSVRDFRLALTTFLTHRESLRLSKDAGERLALHSIALKKAQRNAEPPLSQEDRARIYRLFTECRFGFDQALTIWPDNEEAEGDREKLLCAMFDFELYQRDAVAASLLLDELADPPAEFYSRLQTLQQELLEEAARIEKDRQISFDVNLDLASRARSLMCVLLGLLFGGVPIINYWLVSTGLATLTFQEYLTQFAIILPGAAAVCLLLRKRLLANAINARIVACVFAILIGCLIVRVVGFILAMTPAECIAMENALLSFSMIMMTVTVDRRLWPAALAFLGGALGGAYFLDKVLIFDGVSNAAALWLIAWAWRARSTR